MNGTECYAWDCQGLKMTKRQYCGRSRTNTTYVKILGASIESEIEKVESGGKGESEQ